MSVPSQRGNRKWKRGSAFWARAFLVIPQNKATGIHKVLTTHFLGGLIPGVQEEGTRYLCQDGEP